MSLSIRRAWNEIVAICVKQEDTASLSLRRAWIEIIAGLRNPTEQSRSPYGERGLKSPVGIEVFDVDGVALLTESVD